jgi:hypothetical protein
LSVSLLDEILDNVEIADLAWLKPLRIMDNEVGVLR